MRAWKNIPEEGYSMSFLYVDVTVKDQTTVWKNLWLNPIWLFLCTWRKYTVFYFCCTAIF